MTSRTTCEGSSIKLTCSYSGSDAKVIWLRNGALLTKDSRYVLKDSDGVVTLEINSVSVDDSGKYFCVVNNENGEAESSCTVTVFKKAEEDKVDDQSRPQSQNKTEEQTKRLLESVQDQQQRTGKSSLDVKQNGAQKVKVVDEISKTKTSDLESSINGKENVPSETKKLRNEQKTRESKRKPTFDSRLTNRTSAAGSPIKLTCSYSGSNVRITWMKDGNLLEHGSKFAIYEEDGLSTLDIQHSTVQDSGIYVCIASNSNGEVETSSIVTIYEKAPEVLTSPPIFSSGIRGGFETKISVKLSAIYVLERKVIASQKCAWIY